MGKPMSTVYVPDEYGRLVPTQMPTQIGFIGLYAGPEPPEGYLYCDGSAIGRETYSELFEAVGTLYGAGDGVSTFELPDARGVFFRGDGGENSAAMGTRQGDAIRELVGSFTITGKYDGISSFGTLPVQDVSGVCEVSFYASGMNISNYTSTGTQQPAGVRLRASKTVPTAAEVRPINLALKPCIRYI